MYTVYVRRKRGRKGSGYYNKQFDSLKDAAKFIVSPHNYGKIIQIQGTTRREDRIVAMKCDSVYRRIYTDI